LRSKTCQANWLLSFAQRTTFTSSRRNPFWKTTGMLQDPRLSRQRMRKKGRRPKPPRPASQSTEAFPKSRQWGGSRRPQRLQHEQPRSSHLQFGANNPSKFIDRLQSRTSRIRTALTSISAQASAMGRAVRPQLPWESRDGPAAPQIFMSSLCGKGRSATPSDRRERPRG
jgi:hypothetical protein